MNPNLVAALSTIGWSEGTVTSPLTKRDGYDVIVTGIDKKPEVFTDFSNHPFCGTPPRHPKIINSKGLESTASGRYQIMAHWWPAYKKLLKLPDFSPASQDAVAVQMIRECHALEDILAGRIADALHKCRSRWASLPGAGYGQHENPLAGLQLAFTKAGGVLA